MKTKILLALVGCTALALAACEEKKGDAPKTPTTKSVTEAAKDATKDAGKAVTDTAKKGAETVKDATKGAVDAGKDAAKKTGDALKDGADKAKDAVKDGADKAKGVIDDMANKAKEWGGGYLDNLGALTTKLEGIKTKDDAAKALPDVKSALDKVNGVIENLGKMSPDLKAKMMTEWKPKLEPLATKFQAQIDRLMKDDAIKGVIGDTFKNFKLFQ